MFGSAKLFVDTRICSSTSKLQKKGRRIDYYENKDESLKSKVTIPGKAGGFQFCEPLKAAKQGRSRGPNSLRHLYGGNLSPQPELLQSLVFLLLMPDVVANHLLVPADS